MEEIARAAADVRANMERLRELRLGKRKRFGRKSPLATSKSEAEKVIQTRMILFLDLSYFRMKRFLLGFQFGDQ
jgi:hypothetical protein